MKTRIIHNINFIVSSDPDYHYSVEVGDLYQIKYVEEGRPTDTIGFGSIEEMEAVAKAMMQAVKTYKEMV